MKNDPETQATDDTGSTAPSYRLKLLSGLHAGAERECHEGDMLIVGTHADCDVILADADVAERHCVIGFTNGKLVVRPIATGVQSAGMPLARGQTHTVPLFQSMQLGAVEMIAGPADDPVWTDRFNTMTPQPSLHRLLHPGIRLPLAAMALAVIALTTAIALSASTRETEIEPVSPRASLEQVLDELKLDEATLSGDDGPPYQITGAVPDQAALEQLRQRTAMIDPGVQVSVRVGSDIANDVREALRLEGVRAQTRYLGGGQVLATGYFPDEQRVVAILKSPLVLAIPGLEDVKTETLVDSPTPEPAADDEPFKPYSIVPGPEPYLIGPEDSRYYVGADIPSLGKLVDIDGQTLYIDTGYTTKILQIN